MQEIAVIAFIPDGTGHCLYHEAIDLHTIGMLTCRRASRIEFNAGTQEWEVRPAESERALFSSPSRKTCLEWEREHLDPMNP